MSLSTIITELNATKAYAYDCFIQQKQWGENLQNAENKIFQLSQEVQRINNENSAKTESPTLLTKIVGSEAEDDIQP